MRGRRTLPSSSTPTTGIEFRPDWRVVVVVGKGGVGKTTAACASALHLADTGQSTILISTDPAHSVRDVFANEQCSERLQLLEFDAAAYAATWLERARPALVELVERGTYLDAADARGFLDLSLPGVDEVMAALRLAELAGSGARIVVDTAPIGHTLRLLDAADVLESWIHALDAMAAKARAVSLALVGTTTVAAAEALLAEWQRRASSFRAILRSAEFVVVTQADRVVAAETERLIAQLERRGLSISAVIANRGPAPHAHWYAPAFERPPVGCNGLRTWWDSLSNEPTRPASPARTGRPQSAAEVVPLPQEPLILVAGKGGVGKSTCAAALAVARSEALSACLVSTDPAGSLGLLLGVQVAAEPTQVTPTLRAWQLDADRALHELRGDYELQVRAVFQQFGLEHTIALDRAVIERLWGLAPPGLDEIVALTELLAADEECEAVVLDSAPTGHFLRLIALPRIALDWSHALLRLLLKYRAASSLDEFTEGVLRFARQTRDLQRRLITPGETAAVLVTLDEPVVWAETERLHAAMEAAKIPVAALIINRAEAGPFRGHPFTHKVPRVIRAPQLAEPPSNGAALRAFLGSWELVR